MLAVRWAWLGVFLAFALALPGGVRDAYGGDVRTVKDRPYPEKFRERVAGGVARALESLHEWTQRRLHIHGEDARFFWSADVLWAFRREGRGLELQADEEIRARLSHRAPAKVEEASRLVLALCARPLPDGDPFSKRPSQGPALAEQDRPVVERTVRLLLGGQVMRPDYASGAERDLPEEVLRRSEHGGWSELWALGTDDPIVADMRGTGNALLALEAASNAGVAVPPERFLAALELLLRWQAPTGRAIRLRIDVVEEGQRHSWSEKAQARGWGWTPRQSEQPLGDTTASGVLGLALCMDMLREYPDFTEELRTRTHEGILDGLAWIQRHYTVRRDPAPQGGLTTYARLLPYRRQLWLLRLIQIGEHLRLRRIGSHDIYRECAEVILDEQEGDGGWEASSRRPCAPLLTLLRAGPVPSSVVLAPPDDGED